MEFVGNLIQKLDVREGDGINGHWKIGSYLLQTVEMYPKRMVVDVMDGQFGRLAQWDAFIGKNVMVQFAIEAREKNGRWFNSIRAWNIKEDAPESAQEPTQPATKPATEKGETEDDGDLPF